MSPYYDGFCIDIYRYANDKFIGGINFDKQPDMNFTGSNTKMGSLITFKIKEPTPISHWVLKEFSLQPCQNKYSSFRRVPQLF